MIHGAIKASTRLRTGRTAQDEVRTAMDRARQMSACLGGLAMLGVVLCGTATSVSAQGAADARAVLIPVQFSAAQDDEPLVAPYIEDVATGLRRSWSGDVLEGVELSEQVKVAWVDPVDTKALDALEREVEAGTQQFYGESPSDAIPTLEKVVDRAEGLMGHVSADPKRAALLLKAHLLLWWSLKQVGESARLGPLMAQTAERFPAAVVSSLDMAPDVAQAFSAAREAQRADGVTLTVVLESDVEGPCDIRIDGFSHGDRRTVGIAVRKGRTYYVTGGCGGDMLPPRRVVVDGPVEVRLDNVLARTLRRKQLGTAVWMAGAQDKGADLARVGTTVGALLDAGTVVLAGVYAGPQGPVLQLDNVSIRDGIRRCSVRLVLERNTSPGDIDAAVRATVLRRPVEGRLTFRGYNQEGYMSPGDYLDVVVGDGFQRIFTWTTATLGGVALTSGLVMELISQGRQDDLDNCFGQTECRGTARMEGMRGDLNDALVTRDALYVTSGVLVGAAVLFYFLESPSLEDAPASGPMGSWGVAPWASEAAFGVGMGGTF